MTVIPIALFFWLGNSVFAYVNSDNTDSKEGLLHFLNYLKSVQLNNHFIEKHLFAETISPSKWLTAVTIPILFAIHGYRRGSVNFSGAILGW